MCVSVHVDLKDEEKRKRQKENASLLEVSVLTAAL